MMESAKIIDFNEERRKRSIKEIIDSLDELYDKASIIKREFADLVYENPEQAINRLPEYLERIRDVNPNRSFVEATCWGPNPDWTGELLDIVSVAYSGLSRELRGKLLKECLSFIDHLNFLMAQEHVAKINEPLLVRDILVSAPLYWPGIEIQTKFLEKNKDIASFVKNLPEVGNNFWLALAIIWGGYATLPVSQWYYNNFPDIVDGTLEFIAGRVFHWAKGDSSKFEEFIKKFDPTFHEKIKEKISEEDWIKVE